MTPENQADEAIQQARAEGFLAGLFMGTTVSMEEMEPNEPTDPNEFERTVDVEEEADKFVQNQL